MSIKLLIVDNEPEQLDKDWQAAKEAGFHEREIVSATSVADAEVKLMSETFDVAVVDLVLTEPELGSDDPEEGLGLIRLIHRYQPECKIVALTRKLDNEVGIRAMMAGAQDFVCSRWIYINWKELLVQRLQLWRGVVGGRNKKLTPV